MITPSQGLCRDHYVSVLIKGSAKQLSFRTTQYHIEVWQLFILYHRHGNHVLQRFHLARRVLS